MRLVGCANATATCTHKWKLQTYRSTYLTAGTSVGTGTGTGTGGDTGDGGVGLARAVQCAGASLRQAGGRVVYTVVGAGDDCTGASTGAGAGGAAASASAASAAAASLVAAPRHRIVYLHRCIASSHQYRSAANP